MKLFSLNLVLFQALWFCCILGAAYNNFIPAWSVLACLISLNLLKPVKSDLNYLAVFITAGFLTDSLLSALNWISYKPYIFPMEIAPMWILFLWIGFALSMRWSMNWLITLPKLAYPALMIGGPLSYFGAQRLGAIEMVQPLAASTLISLSWGVILIVLHRMPSKKEDFLHAS